MRCLSYRLIKIHRKFTCAYLLCDKASLTHTVYKTSIYSLLFLTSLLSCVMTSALFSPGVRNPGSEKIVLQQTPLAGFKTLLSFCYRPCANQLQGVSEEAVLDLLALARRYPFGPLVSLLARALRSDLTVGNLLARLDSALHHGLEELEKACLAFFDKHAMEMFEDASFLKLSKVS